MRESKVGKVQLSITPGRLHIAMLNLPQAAGVDADYSVTKDSVLYGVVTSLTDSEEAVPRFSWADLPFSCRFRVDEGVLTITDVKQGVLTGKDEKGRSKQIPLIQAVLPGRYTRAESAERAARRNPTASRPVAGTLRPQASAVPTNCDEPGERQDYRTPLRGPIPPGTKLPQCEEPPDEALVLSALRDKQASHSERWAESRDDFEIVTEKIVDKVDPPRFFPLIGPAQLHHCHYKCTVYYTGTIELSWPFPFRVNRPCVEVVYIDKDHLHLCLDQGGSR
jgi:hypothetical protein